jgi:hypothetical protein
MSETGVLLEFFPDRVNVKATAFTSAFAKTEERSRILDVYNSLTALSRS